MTSIKDLDIFTKEITTMNLYYTATTMKKMIELKNFLTFVAI